jgi:ubiquinone/menaquinone biosynthesis C-methylase UbiE
MSSSPTPRRPLDDQPDAPAPQRPDFDLVATRYDELRPVDENWWERLEVIAREGDLAGRRVLDVGCGTGSVAAALVERYRCRVWGVDPSPEMLAVAREKLPSTVALRVASAEALPFRSGWFERAVMSLVVHLVDRPRAFAEARRVLDHGGRLVVASFDPEHFHRYYLNALFPSLRELDLARFPDRAELEQELVDAGFARVRLVPLSQVGCAARDDVLRKVEGRHISTLQLLSDEEFRTGLARAERELPEVVEYRLEHLVVVAEAA